MSEYAYYSVCEIRSIGRQPVSYESDGHTSGTSDIANSILGCDYNMAFELVIKCYALMRVYIMRVLPWPIQDLKPLNVFILEQPKELKSTMYISLIVQLLSCCIAVNASIVRPRSVVNGPCTGKDGHAGVCIPKSSCDGAGETWINDACPGTPENIKCCTKASCQQAGRSGDCRWSDKCGSGRETLSGLCPGPNAFKCCVPNKEDSGGDLGKKILKKAREAEGTPYSWGGGSCKGITKGGYDCSGLVSWAVCQVTGRDLFAEGLRVTRSMYCASEGKLKYE